MRGDAQGRSGAHEALGSRGRPHPQPQGRAAATPAAPRALPHSHRGKMSLAPLFQASRKKRGDSPSSKIPAGIGHRTGPAPRATEARGSFPLCVGPQSTCSFPSPSRGRPRRGEARTGGPPAARPWRARPSGHRDSPWPGVPEGRALPQLARAVGGTARAPGVAFQAARGEKQAAGCKPLMSLELT